MKIFYVYNNTGRKLTAALTMKKAYALAKLFAARGHTVKVGQ